MRLGSSKLVSRWIAVSIVASIVAAISGGVAEWAAFAPSRIWRGEVWRLATWVFVEGSPLQLILTCVAIYHFGGELAPRWGERRLRRFLVDVLGGAAVVAALLALVSDDLWRTYRVGGWAVGNALTIAWARQYPDTTLVIYGLLKLRGRDLVTVIIGATVVYAIFAGPLSWALELVVCAAAYYYPKARLERRA